MVIASLVKDIGGKSAALMATERARLEYPAEDVGCTTSVGDNEDEAQINITGSPNLDAANAILAAVEIPTCESFEAPMKIRVNAGAYIVDDDFIDIVASSVEKKFFLVELAIDNASKDFEVIIYERLESEAFGDLPGGKTHVANLKTYSLAIDGTSLVEDENYIF